MSKEGSREKENGRFFHLFKHKDGLLRKAPASFMSSWVRTRTFKGSFGEADISV